MKILVGGSGGREAAMCDVAEKEGHEVFCAPGNPGIKNRINFEVEGRPIDLFSKDNFPHLVQVVRSESIDLVWPGPEKPLCDGVVDYFIKHGLGNKIFGPTASAARLESDKFFSYECMNNLGILQAYSELCGTTQEAINAIRSIGSRKGAQGVVIKARGLTGGKGVTVCGSVEDALKEITGHAGQYGPEVIVAERLFGPEFSVFGISDGENVLPILYSFQDHKRRDEGDQGPNTGGMGAYGPAQCVADAGVIRDICKSMMTPLVRSLPEQYVGVLYGGMILTEHGPKVLEWNCRLGDLEWQVAARLIDGGLVEAIQNAMHGEVLKSQLRLKYGSSVCVVVAAQDYPGKVKSGAVIRGIEEAERIPGVQVYQAGTSISGGQLTVKSGRVLGVTSYAASLVEAIENAKAGAERISFEGSFYRKDIGAKGLVNSP